MSLNEIKIVRTLPVVGGFVKIPRDNSNLPRVNPDEVPFDTFIFGVTRNMTFIQFPEVSADASTNYDWQGVVEDIAVAKI